MFSWFKNIRFSQKLSTIVTIIWVLGIIANYIALWVCGIDLSIIFNYIQTAFLGVSAAYLTKSGIEKVKGCAPTNTNTNSTDKNTNGSV